jgi:hypothetical protein
MYIYIYKGHKKWLSIPQLHIKTYSMQADQCCLVLWLSEISHFVYSCACLVAYLSDVYVTSEVTWGNTRPLGNN